MKTVETYKITELYASAWQNAIINVANVINANYNIDCNSGDLYKMQSIALALGVRFDVNGEIVK